MQSDTERLDAVLADWQALPLTEPPRLVKTFTAGKNHKTYLLATANDQFVLKLFRQPYSHAIAVQRWAAQHSLAPTVVYANQQQDVMLSSYVGGGTLLPAAIDSKTLKSLADALRHLHSLPTVKFGTSIDRFDLIKFCDSKLQSIDSSRLSLEALHQRLLPALQIFLQDDTAWCVCHNDLVADNIFSADGQTVFIDWEYAQVHNPWFDLAAIIYYWQLDKEQATQFLHLYRPDWGRKAATPIFIAAQCALLWVDMLWHLARDGSNIGPDLRNKLASLKRLAERLSIAL